MGFSASLVCLGWCIPVIMPYSATAERPGVMSGLASSFLFCVGRLVSYIGLMSLFLIFREIVTISPIFGAVATLVSGIILVLSGLSSVGAIKTHSAFGRLLCQQVASTRSPLFLGVLTGLRPCGPLLAALAFMLTLPTIPRISIFMLSFWIASSVLVMVLGVGQKTRHRQVAQYHWHGNDCYWMLFDTYGKHLAILGNIAIIIINTSLINSSGVSKNAKLQSKLGGMQVAWWSGFCRGSLRLFR
jgi:sulfite exporter TauE/SafE